MKQFLCEKGEFGAAEFKILMDDGEHELPTARNILQGIAWLVEGAQAGDALFMHYRYFACRRGEFGFRVWICYEPCARSSSFCVPVAIDQSAP
jgi:hypothetical protein